MDNKEIVVEIKENGEIQAETFGFVGTDCELELDRLLKGLANKKAVERKAEYYKNKTTVSNKQKVGNE